MEIALLWPLASESLMGTAVSTYATIVSQDAGYLACPADRLHSHFPN